MDRKEIEKVMELGKEAGFSRTGPLDCSTIKLLPEVRQACEACAGHGKCWSCPPGCGSLEECREKIARYHIGVLVQTTAELEDELDGEAMMEAGMRHKEQFYAFERTLREQYPDMLALGAGACNKCKTCTYPDEPCRFPKEAFSSMEAYGMLITEVCQANGMDYYYGPCTITYTSCYLLG